MLSCPRSWVMGVDWSLYGVAVNGSPSLTGRDCVGAGTTIVVPLRSRTKTDGVTRRPAYLAPDMCAIAATAHLGSSQNKITYRMGFSHQGWCCLG